MKHLLFKVAWLLSKVAQLSKLSQSDHISEGKFVITARNTQYSRCSLKTYLQVI